MLGKLIRYEFRETYKFFLIMYSLVIIFCFMSGVGISKIDVTEMTDIKFFLYMFVLVVTNVISRTITYIIIVRRYYQLMLKDQGYLTHTLPVKMSERLSAMLIVDFVWILFSGIVLLASAVALTLDTDILRMVLQSVVEMLQFVSGEWMIILFVLLFMLILLAQEILTLLCFFAGMSLGQLLKGHLLIGAIVFCYVLNYVKNLLVNMILNMIPRSLTVALMTIKTKAEFVDLLSQGNLFLIGGGVLFVTITLAGVYYFLAHYMMTSRLELE